MKPVTSEICMELAAALAADTAFMAVAQVASAQDWDIQVGADARAVLADVSGPHCVILPRGMRMDGGPVDVHEFAVLLTFVSDAVLANPARLLVYDVLEVSALRELVRVLLALRPHNGGVAELTTELSIDNLPLAVLTVSVTYNIDSPFGAKTL